MKNNQRCLAAKAAGRMARTAADIIDIGKELITVKAALGHGQFLPWIEAEFGMSGRTAQRFMVVADRFGSKATDSSHLSFEALATLAAPSTPEEMIDAVVERSANGETFTAADIKAMKIAENLHRHDLTKDQRDEHIRRYAELLEARAIDLQNAKQSEPRAARCETGATK